jgi:hypothetical protein
MSSIWILLEMSFDKREYAVEKNYNHNVFHGLNRKNIKDRCFLLLEKSFGYVF